MALRAEQPGELDELRRINQALTQLYANRTAAGGGYASSRAQLRTARADEVRRLRRLPINPWSHGQLADALGVSRASIQQWERPTLDRRRPTGGGHAPPLVWIGATASLAASGTLRHVVCHFCHHAVRLLVG